MKINFNNNILTPPLRRIPKALTQTFYTGTLVNDVFVKSPDISFCANFDNIYSPLKEELEQYILNAPELSYEQLAHIEKKYFPDVEVLKYEKKQTQCSELFSCASFSQVFIPVVENGILKLASSNNKIKVNLPEGDDEDERLKFSTKLIHENTHLIQQNCDDRVNDCEFFNSRFTEYENEPQLALNTFYASYDLFNSLEFDLMVVSQILASGWHDSEIDKEAIDKRSIKKYGCDIITNFKERIEQNMQNIKNDHEGCSFDEKIAIEYVAFAALQEKEAYATDGRDKGKTYLYYDFLAQAAKQLAQELYQPE